MNAWEAIGLVFEAWHKEMGDGDRYMIVEKIGVFVVFMFKHAIKINNSMKIKMCCVTEIDLRNTALDFQTLGISIAHRMKARMKIDEDYHQRAT